MKHKYTTILDIVSLVDLMQSQNNSKNVVENNIFVWIANLYILRMNLEQSGNQIQFNVLVFIFLKSSFF